MASHWQVVCGGQAPGSLAFPPQDWPGVSGTPDTVEKALWVVGKTLEKAQCPRSHGGRGPGVSALRAEMETTL